MGSASHSTPARRASAIAASSSARPALGTQLRRAIIRRLKIEDADLLNFAVFKRSYDARKKSSAILFVYVIDLEARNEAAILARFAVLHVEAGHEQVVNALEQRIVDDPGRLRRASDEALNDRRAVEVTEDREPGVFQACGELVR